VRAGPRIKGWDGQGQPGRAVGVGGAGYYKGAVAGESVWKRRVIT